MSRRSHNYALFGKKMGAFGVCNGRGGYAGAV